MIAPWICQSTIDRLTTAFFIDTFTVQAFTIVPDGSGGETQTWADETVDVMGMLEQFKISGTETALGGSQQELRRWIISLEYGTPLDASKRIIQTKSNGVAITPRYFKIVVARAGDTFAIDVAAECVELPNLSS